ncbi:FAD binding domain-containing protein [Neomoorella humiferrea]|uniref:Carbon monoxide dehydrogenase medium chain n=1 Tax=Neomoorella humiferrea TaxID=676965 RepID=A0A2T0ALR4_9FIRM|nr:xanthine dehydrogenase family protein subunit M [Moorella humiferrea]PRR69688.1 Carbon monoxide dehydrogenase medium chain [Moorella humiferrea]
MNSFKYISPKTKEEALKILDELGEKGKIVAGSTNVLPDIKAKKISSCVLVDISNLSELKGVNEVGDKIAIGSLTTINQLLQSNIIAREAQVLWQACRNFADPLVRNRATIGGNIVNASPAADGVIPLLALDATVCIESFANGKKEAPLSEFFKGPGKTILQSGDLVTSVNFPKASGMKSAFIKFGLRKAMAISLANIGVVLQINEDTITEARIALGALAPTPLRARETENYLRGKQINDEVMAEASQIIKTEIKPISDIRASQAYRQHLTGVLLRRAIKAAIA